MKFRKFGKTVLTAALSSAIVISLSSCVRSFTVGYLYVTGTVTSTPAGNGIISGFKIDNNTGKLKAIHGLPVATGGSNPVRAVLLSGGQFVYILNRGTTASGGSDCTVSDPCPNANIEEFVVGGNGILTPQQTFSTQGINPFRLIQDTSGNFLFALDHDAPSYQYCGSFGPTCGDVTVFSINTTTGRLTLVTNAQLTSSQGTEVTYFPVPSDPIDFNFGTGYLLTLGGLPGTQQTVYPYTYNSTNGQLTVSQSVPQLINNGSGGPLEQGTAIDFAGGRAYILDNEPLTVTSTTSGSTTTSSAQVLQFNVGANGALQSTVQGAVQDDVGEQSPIYLIAESKGKFVYVANQAGASSATGAGITGFTLDPVQAQLSETPGSPWGTGAGPQCLLEDPSNQFFYTANADSTISGRLLDPNSGQLNNLRGSTGSFPLSGPATWCVATGRTN